MEEDGEEIEDDQEDDNESQKEGEKLDTKRKEWKDTEDTGRTWKKIRKDPTVDTSFLPDREREEAENRLREELRQQWVEQQKKLKEEDIDVTFSYWDGSGHRRTVRVKKGES